MNTQTFLTNYKSNNLRREIFSIFNESSNDFYKDRKWDYNSIRTEIDRIMNAHTKSELTLAYLERLKVSVRNQLNKETNKYAIRSLQNGISDIINCTSSIKLYMRNKKLESTYVTNKHK